MKLEVGMWVRTKHQGICRIIGFASSITEDYIENEKGFIIPKYEISKASHNIKDLIQENDYVNGHLVIKRHNDLILEDTFDLVEDEDIKTIVTREQFEQIQYKVGD